MLFQEGLGAVLESLRESSEPADNTPVCMVERVTGVFLQKRLILNQQQTNLLTLVFG